MSTVYSSTIEILALVIASSLSEVLFEISAKRQNTRSRFQNKEFTNE